MLRSNMPSSTYSRLACCVRVTPDMNEMICVVGNNQSTGGEWFTGHVDDAFWETFENKKSKLLISLFKFNKFYTLYIQLIIT